MLDPWSALKHGREATTTLYEASWIESEIGGFQKMGPECRFPGLAGLLLHTPIQGSKGVTSVMEQELVT